ncbi:MAG: hypothetical protein AAGI66_06575 [Cyanobacteria bacterium P01_H01_bin.74]
MTDQQQDQKKKAPLQSFKDGAVTIKIWEQQAGERKFADASIGKLYKDEKTGDWRETRSFNNNDLLKLQNLIPEARAEMQQWQEYYKSINPEQEQNQAPQRNEAVTERDEVLPASNKALLNNAMR